MRFACEGVIHERSPPRHASSMLHEPPADVVTNLRLLEVWKRSQHILPAIAFERRYWRTVLLPLKTQSARLDVDRLRQIMSLKPNATRIQLLTLARSEYGLRHGRARTILHMRRGLEWDWMTAARPSRCCFSAIEDSSLRKSIPNEIPIEYLVAELERHGFEFRVQKGSKLQIHWPGKVMLVSEVTAWLKTAGSTITQYIRKRDGISSAPSSGEQFLWEPPPRTP